MRMSDSHSRRQPAKTHRIRFLVMAGAFMLGLLALAACGGSGPAIIQPTQSFTTPGATGTPGIGQYAYLYSRVDYPLQVPINAGDTVTLTLSPQSNILTVTPSPGSGSQTIGAPIPLPTDLALYQDIGAEADTVDTAKSPVAWQLVSPPRQSLLTGSGTTQRGYRQVAFQWHVQALSAGENTINIELRLYYIYLDGSEHDGTIQITQQPIPVVAVQPSPISNSLPTLKLPIAGLTWLAGFIAVLRFIWKAYQTIHDVTEPVKQAAEVAVAVKKRVGGSDAPQRPAANGYPNPWAPPRTWQSPPPSSGSSDSLPSSMPPGAPDTTHPNARARPMPPPAPPPAGSSPLWPPDHQPPSGPPRGSGGW